MLIMRQKELSTVLNSYKEFNNTPELKQQYFEDVHLFLDGNRILFFTLGNFLNSHKVVMFYTYVFEGDPFTELDKQFYTLKMNDFTSVIKFFSETITLDFTNERLFLFDSENTSQRVFLNRLETPEVVRDWATNFLDRNGTILEQDFESNISEEDLADISEIVDFRNSDKKDTNSYISFLNQYIATQQFNYATLLRKDVPFKGRIPTPVLKTILKFKEASNNFYIARTGKTLIVSTEKLKIIVNNIDDNIFPADTLRYTQGREIVLNKKEFLTQLQFIRTFCELKTGYLQMTDNGLILRNTSTDDSENKSLFVSKNFEKEHTIPYRKVFGFDIDILKGMVSLISEEQFSLIIEQDTEDVDSYLLFIVDNITKNAMYMDVYN